MAAKKRTTRKGGAQSKRKAGSVSSRRSAARKQPTNPGGDGYSEAERAEKRAIILAELAKRPLYFLAAARAKVHRNTLDAWRREDPEFDLECRAARAQAICPAVDRMASTDAATSAAAARWLEKVAPAEFRRDDFLDDPLQTQARPIRVVFETRRS